MNITAFISLSQGAISLTLQKSHNHSNYPCFAFHDLHDDTAKSAKSRVKTANKPPPPPRSYITVRRGDLDWWIQDEYFLFTVYLLTWNAPRLQTSPFWGGGGCCQLHLWRGPPSLTITLTPPWCTVDIMLQQVRYWFEWSPKPAPTHGEHVGYYCNHPLVKIVLFLSLGFCLQHPETQQQPGPRCGFRAEKYPLSS